ncbi:MAG TPA: AmmeMemoRadiSam system protein B [archaeon]|nr:AmmeMemoRadiSam system protein B [archaeon]
MRKILSGLLLAAVFSIIRAQAGEIRPPAVAGSFYPGDSLELSRMVSEMLTHSKLSQPRMKPLALISPHAGYVYSGMIAAAGYKQLKDFSYSTVVIIAPSHREYFGFASVYPGSGYRTPLGVVGVDSVFAARLVEAGGDLVRKSSRGHSQGGLGMGEHALEIQLPFLQLTLGDFKLVPIIMGEQPFALCKTLAEALAKVIGAREDVLIIASSDLSHFHTYREANRLDSKLASYVEHFDYLGLSSALDRREVEACGGGPILSVMMACEKLGARQVRILLTANSGDVTGDKDRVVGYLSAMFYKSTQSEKDIKQSSNLGGSPMGLTEREKQYLLDLARKTIIHAVAGGEAPEYEAITPTLGEKRGAFVTIKKKGQLRGCIGQIIALQPLVDTVREMAIAAALRDPRFPPVTEDELKDLEIEISALTPIHKVTDINSIEVGKDGLIIKRGAFQGLLLPQVATEYGWDRDTFLAQTCRKAGLPADAWKQEGTEIHSFRAEVFGEKERH